MDGRTRKRILLADNRPEYRRSVIELLELEGYLVVQAETPEEAHELLETEEFDLALVDLRMRDDGDLNDMSGLAVAKFASACEIPCVIVTAFPTVELARTALRSLGAEPFAKDLITKASGPQALIDSISLIFNPMRARNPTIAPAPPAKNERKSIQHGLSIDLDKERVSKDGVEIKVPPKQYLLLAVLRQKDGGVCSCKELIKAIYSEELSDKAAKNDGRLRNLVERTNKKLKERGSDHRPIEAVLGRGYRLNLKN